jgi:hypothetical protein
MYATPYVLGIGVAPVAVIVGVGVGVGVDVPLEEEHALISAPHAKTASAW